MANKKAGAIPTIKSNLKTSDRISLIYNDKEVEMSIADFKTFLNDEGYINSANTGMTSFSRTFTQAEIRTFNSANGGYGVEILPAPGAGKVYQIEPPTMRWEATGGSFTSAIGWIYYYNEAGALSHFTVATPSLPATFFDIPYYNNINTAAGDGSDGQFPSDNIRVMIYTDAAQSSYEGTMTLKFDYKIIDFN